MISKEEHGDLGGIFRNGKPRLVDMHAAASMTDTCSAMFNLHIQFDLDGIICELVPRM